MSTSRDYKNNIDDLFFFIAPATPINLRASETNFTVIELSWERPNPSNGIITNYTVC